MSFLWMSAFRNALAEEGLGRMFRQRLELNEQRGVGARVCTVVRHPVEPLDVPDQWF